VEILSIVRPRYCLLVALAGALELAGSSGKSEAHGTKGMIQGVLPGTRVMTSDARVRLLVWMDGARLERMVRARLGEPPRESLTFAPGVDWSSGPGRVVWRMILRLLEELHDPDGLLGDPVARETFTDLFLQTVLSRLPQTIRRGWSARPLRRSPVICDGPRRSCTPRPIGRSVWTMSPPPPAAQRQPCMPPIVSSATRHHSPRCTPCGYGACARHCRQPDDEVSTRSIARRFGFTNPSRFLTAYAKQFGGRPNETRRQG
jgi:AraC-like DNA-binding protein